MSLFAKIKSGELSKEGFERTLADYETQKIELKRRESFIGPELFKKMLSNIDMQISMAQIFIDKYDEIKQTKTN